MAPHSMVICFFMWRELVWNLFYLIAAHRQARSTQHTGAQDTGLCVTLSLVLWHAGTQAHRRTGTQAGTQAGTLAGNHVAHAPHTHARARTHTHTERERDTCVHMTWLPWTNTVHIWPKTLVKCTRRGSSSRVVLWVQATSTAVIYSLYVIASHPAALTYRQHVYLF